MMDARGGCCIARYAGVGGGGGGAMYDMSKVERIMLKFRPIAPKPVAAGSGSGVSTAESGRRYGRRGRAKRKYAKRYSNSDVAKKRKAADSMSPSRESVSGGGDTVVTLSLMPETPDRKENLPFTGSMSEDSDLVGSTSTAKARRCNNNNKLKSVPIWLSFDTQQIARDSHASGELIPLADQAVVMIQAPAPPQPERPEAVSYVTVECVTDTWLNGLGPNFTDEERVVMMNRDTCPGFLSGGGGPHSVVWTNKAYREMVGGGEVVLVKKDSWPVTMPAAFTCKVRVTCGNHRGRSTSCSTLTVPCDVWRLQSGGYAWRLDVKAALRLGR